jgi:NADH-quinone oxidoreductase subunit M
VGAVMLVVSSLVARAEADMKRWVAWAGTAYAGLVLVGIGSRTPQGIAAAVHVAVALGLGMGLFALLVNALETRARTLELQRFGGLSEDMPHFAGLFFVAVLASFGLPGLAGFWGPLLAVVGAFPRHPALSVLVIAGIVLLAVVQMRVAGRILFGAVPAKWRQSKYLEAFGGRFPELYRDELLAALPLAVLLVVLGFSPRTLFSLLDAAVLDLHRLVDAAGVTQVG